MGVCGYIRGREYQRHEYKKREGFNRMITDELDGKKDLILTKPFPVWPETPWIR